jgi:hypothetical protein
MSFKTIAGTAALAVAASGLVALPTAPAFADDDRKVRHGVASKGAKYTYKLVDRGDDPDRLRAVLKINSSKANKRWTVKVFKGKKRVYKDTKRTNRHGNVRFADTFRSDDDRRIKVVARSGYGERLTKTMRLDD